MSTLVIDNFRGTLTNFQFGQLNSGRSDESVCSGQNPFVRPGSLTWNEAPTLIDPNGTVVTDLIMDGQERVESGVLYVYAIGHTGRLYKIQVNDPSSYTPDFDNPVLLTTLTIGSPTFTRGGFLEFFGATEKIYIGHDKGVTSINFDGTGEAAVSGTWVQNVPRPMREFIGKLEIGNGSNIAEIDSTGTVTSSTKLSPAFPTNSQVRDMDFSIDGNYLEMIVSTLPLGDITSATQDTSTSVASATGYNFKWNGTDTGFTTFDFFPNFTVSGNATFQNYQYVFATDQFGTAIYNPTEKIFGVTESPSVNPNATSSTGNIMQYLAPLYYLGVLETDMYCWGHFDFEVGQPIGYWDLMFLNANTPETDIVQVPWQVSVSSTGIGSSSNGYANNVYGEAKIYFSTLETSSSPTTKYRLYKWRTTNSINIPSGDIIVGAVYQTQTQIFSKRVKVKEIRVYSDPWVAGNSFTVSLTGGDRNVLTGSSKTFTAAVNPGDGVLTIGDDFAMYNPQMKPTHSLALQIFNEGLTNYVIHKVEIDIDEAGGR